MMRENIIFRNVKEDGGFTWWHVEVYSPEGTTFPVGTAYVISNDTFAQLNFILVADEWRNRGFGKQLIESIKARWPKLVSTEPMGPQGNALLKSCGLSNEDVEDS